MPRNTTKPAQQIADAITDKKKHFAKASVESLKALVASYPGEMREKLKIATEALHQSSPHVLRGWLAQGEMPAVVEVACQGLLDKQARNTTYIVSIPQEKRVAILTVLDSMGITYSVMP